MSEISYKIFIGDKMSSREEKVNNMKEKSLNDLEAYFYQRFGEITQEIRKDKKIQQSYFYETIGIKENQMSKIENAHCQVKAFDYEMIQKILGFDFSLAINDKCENKIMGTEMYKLILYIIDNLSENDCKYVRLFLSNYHKEKGEE